MTQSTLTSKGQTTIPQEVRRALDLKPGMRLLYEIEGDRAVLRAQPTLMAAYGALKSKKVGVDFRKAREAATKAWARKGEPKE